ncbi:MAG TPA: methyltransferase domain-containing protein [Bryobacteraceae bacterium]|nr:methyltransferase domain-containing protein [Bryobacteraceae bacterium]
MNRTRNLAGGNSHEKDLGFDALDFLKKRLETQHHAAWLDLCCGAGRALIPASVERWETTERFDLVTCVHGLHYIGDKLGLLQRASGWLKDGGLLIAHLDYRNLRIKDRTNSAAQMGKDLRRAGFRYTSGRHLLTCGSQTARHLLPYRYLGADDHAGPNYTGQPAVDSYYERTRS